MEKGQLWIIVGVALVVAVISSVITANITGNVVVSSGSRYYYGGSAQSVDGVSTAQASVLLLQVLQHLHR